MAGLDRPIPTVESLHALLQLGVGGLWEPPEPDQCAARRIGMRGRLGLVLTSLLLGGCGSSNPGEAGGGSGGHGVTMVDGGCPVVRLGSPRPRRPIRAAIIAHPGGTHGPDVQARSGARGRFAMALPPGRYIVMGRADSLMPMPRHEHKRVAVRAGNRTWVSFMFDSGIRTPRTR